MTSLDLHRRLLPRRTASGKTAMALLLEISFGESSSRQYPLAVTLAQSMSGYRALGAGRGVVHQVAIQAPLPDEAAWEKLDQLLRMILAWRSAKVVLDRRVWRCGSFLAQLATIKACHGRRVQVGTGDLYCSGKSGPGSEGDYFGCRHAQGVSRMLEGERAAWIRFGTLSQKHDSFRVDKKAIWQTLKAQTQGALCHFCPAFNWSRIRAEVNQLPSVIRLGDQSPFEIRYSEIDPAKALGIKPKERPGTWLEIALSSLEREDKLPAGRQVPNVRYTEVAGQDVALEALKSVVELPLRHATYFEALGVAPQTGVLLYGPPGNGKTLLGKAVATESDAHLEIISGPEVLSPWVGQSEDNLRRIFARARQYAPSVVLIDELDSLAPRRAFLSQQHQVQILSQLLVLLDGLEARGRVAVIGMTNRIEALDPAVCRPGRFDYHLEVPSPDERGRAAILRVHLEKLKTRGRIELDNLVKKTEGFSGAELAALCREAGLQTIQRGLAGGIPSQRLSVGRQDLQAALKAFQGKRVSLHTL
jgi:AAA+ superfamily predicted ATPase